MSDIVKDDTQTPPSLKHQIEDVLRATQTLNGLRIEGLNHKVTAFTRAPLLLEEALAEIKALEQRHADALDALNRMTDQRDEALGGQPAIELPQHRLRVAIQEAAEYNEMIPLHTDDPDALAHQQMVRHWLSGKGMHPQQVDRIGQLVTQLKDATAQCGDMADLLRAARKYFDVALGSSDLVALTHMDFLKNQIDVIDAVLAGQLPDPSRRVSQEQYREILTMLDRTQALLADERATAGWAEKLERRINELQASLPSIPAPLPLLEISHGDLHEAFEKTFPLPTNVSRCGDGYVVHVHGDWMANDYVNKWKGWKAGCLCMLTTPAQHRLGKAHGDVLPAIGETVHFKLASSDSWEPYTVAGFYAWQDLKLDPSLHRVFVRGISATGGENSRLLMDVRRGKPETEQGGAA